MLNLALFISGGGSTASAVISACFKGKLKLKPVLVIASRSNCQGIKKTLASGIPLNDIITVKPQSYSSDRLFGQRLIKECQQRSVDLIGQFGWLPLTPSNLIDIYQGRMINQHPGPLDPPRADFGGKGMFGRRVHAAVIIYRRKTNEDYWTEATTHLVGREFDKGPVIGRKKIQINEDETVESLQEKVLPLEHRLQIDVLNLLIKNKIKILKREKPLIETNCLPVLRQAKETAVYLYPRG